jgi:hypothetical protein
LGLPVGGALVVDGASGHVQHHTDASPSSPSVTAEKTFDGIS